MDIKHLHYFISIVDHGGYSNVPLVVYSLRNRPFLKPLKIRIQLHTPLYSAN